MNSECDRDAIEIPFFLENSVSSAAEKRPLILLASNSKSTHCVATDQICRNFIIIVA